MEALLLLLLLLLLAGRRGAAARGTDTKLAKGSEVRQSRLLPSFGRLCTCRRAGTGAENGRICNLDLVPAFYY